MQPSTIAPMPPRPLKEGQHHLAENPAAHVTPCINDDNIAGLGMIECMAVQLFFGIVIFIDCVDVFAFGHKLQGKCRTNDRLSGGAGDGTQDLGVAYT